MNLYEVGSKWDEFDVIDDESSSEALLVTGPVASEYQAQLGKTTVEF